MHVADTSLEAYADVKPELPAKRREVYVAVAEMGPLSAEEIGIILDWTINRVTARVRELILSNELFISGHRVSESTGKKVRTYSVASTSGR